MGRTYRCEHVALLPLLLLLLPGMVADQLTLLGLPACLISHIPTHHPRLAGMGVNTWRTLTCQCLPDPALGC